MLEAKTGTTETRELAWTRWVLQSARVWDDVSDIVQVIGIKGVDEDHRKFTQYALDLNIVIQAFHNSNVSLDNLKKGEEIFTLLIDYAGLHFNREEKIMTEMNSPLKEAHLEQHAFFLKMIQDHYSDFKRGRLQMVSGLKLSILDWWVNHINVVDYNTFVLGQKAPPDTVENGRQA
ncbi:bacteriohemerythrin [Desulfovibrio inopinatus]|uniref:bacteriohemerythrin n=1 Tax=Desulfovibrio inopinatus TaxID=102109 RepID=UPI00040599D8|nr:hemerythrin family protein [Desulfovibrio inopinatus]